MFVFVQETVALSVCLLCHVLLSYATDQGVTNIRICEHIQIFPDTNIHLYHIRIMFWHKYIRILSVSAGTVHYVTSYRMPLTSHTHTERNTAMHIYIYSDRATHSTRMAILMKLFIWGIHLVKMHNICDPSHPTILRLVLVCFLFPCKIDLLLLFSIRVTHSLLP